MLHSLSFACRLNVGRAIRSQSPFFLHIGNTLSFAAGPVGLKNDFDPVRRISDMTSLANLANNISHPVRDRALESKEYG